eukprot:scaffold77288_cov19-Tisochrysis_lutea.AAC.2
MARSSLPFRISLCMVSKRGSSEGCADSNVVLGMVSNRCSLTQRRVGLMGSLRRIGRSKNPYGASDNADCHIQGTSFQTWLGNQRPSCGEKISWSWSLHSQHIPLQLQKKKIKLKGKI